MKKGLRLCLGLAIIIVGLSLPALEGFIVSQEPSVREVMNIERPDDETLKFVSGVDEIITDKKDEESFAVFNKEFSDRIDGYQTKGQVIMDIYALAGSKVFKKRLKEDYDGKLEEEVSKIIKEVLVDYNVPLTDEMREDLKNKFSAISWSLGGDDDE